MDCHDIAKMVSKSKKLTIRVVADEHCPHCGRAGSPKVQALDGTWAWRCPSTREQCDVQYYYPHDRTFSTKLPEAEERAMRERIAAEVKAQCDASDWICDCSGRGISCSRLIPKGSPVPAGWHLLGKDCN